VGGPGGAQDGERGRCSHVAIVLYVPIMRQLFVALLALCAVSIGAAEGKSVKVKRQSNPVVVVKTSLGSVKIELYPDKAPITVANFLQYAKDGFYDGTIFHRVIPAFMIQGGGYDEQMTRKETRDPIKNEASNGLKNETGTIAMARTSDPDSATAQFFINTKDNPALDYKAGNPGYAVFGKVTEGMDVVRKIEAVKTGSRNGMKDVPLTTVKIESIRAVE
jgi:cyclophilin family peptidyl-prolyl cis-trans isomerase